MLRQGIVQDLDLVKHGLMVLPMPRTFQPGYDGAREIANGMADETRPDPLEIRDRRVGSSASRHDMPGADESIDQGSTKPATYTGHNDPFAGPIKDNTGKLQVKAGQRASKGDLLSIMYYVDNVAGSIPK